MAGTAGYWIGYIGATAIIIASLLAALFYIGTAVVRGVRKLWK